MKTIKHIIIGALGFFLLLVLLDVFINQAGIENTSTSFFDFTLGKMRPPETEYIMYNEGFSIGSFNQGGYMHEFYPPRTQTHDGVVRIAVFGDSYVEGFQVFEKDHFATLLRLALQRKYPDISIEILNFGSSGYDLGDMYVAAKIIAEPYCPDILMFFVSKADLTIKNTMPFSPHVFVENDTLCIKREYTIESLSRYNMVKNLLNYSTIANMLNKARKTNQKQLMSKCFDKFYHSNKKEVPILDVPIEQISDSLDLASRLVIKSLQSSLVFVNRDDNPMPAVVADYVKSLDVPYIDLSIPLQKLYDDGIDPHYWDVTNKFGHWNRDAHQVVADYLYLSLSDFE